MVFAFDEFVIMCILWQIDFLQDDFSYLKSWRAEVDDHSISKTGCTEITQRLSDMVWGQSSGSFEFNYKAVLDEQIREEAAEERTVFIAHLEWLLLFNTKPDFPQSVCHSILIHLLKMPTPKMIMQFESRLSYSIA